MPEDYRVKVGFFAHPKTVKLRRRCGSDGVISLMKLWAFCTSTRTDGDLSGMSDEDIEISSGWDGDPCTWIDAVVDVRFVDGDQYHRRVHDWAEHQPWVAGWKDRSETYRIAAFKRHHKAGRHLSKVAGCPLCYGCNTVTKSSNTVTESGNAVVTLPCTDPTRSNPIQPDPIQTNHDSTDHPQSSSRTVSPGEILERINEWDGWPTPTGYTRKARAIADELGPVSEDELSYGKMDAERAGGSPNPGLLLAIIARHRKERDEYDAEIARHDKIEKDMEKQYGPRYTK